MAGGTKQTHSGHKYRINFAFFIYHKTFDADVLLIFHSQRIKPIHILAPRGQCTGNLTSYLNHILIHAKETIFLRTGSYFTARMTGTVRLGGEGLVEDLEERLVSGSCTTPSPAQGSSRGMGHPESV